MFFDFSNLYVQKTSFFIQQQNLRMSKQTLLQEISNKKSQLKDLQSKCQLQNKKIKLFRKENEELKTFVDEKNHEVTSALLHSKQLIGANEKLKKTIEQIRNQIQMLSVQSIPQSTQKKQQLKPTTKTMVSIKDITINESTQQIDLPACQLLDEDIYELKHFKQINVLILNDNLVSDQGVTAICESFYNLQRLNLAGNRFTAEGLKMVNKLSNLKVLDVRNNQLKDQALEYISNVERLEDLSCSKNAFTDAGAKNLTKLSNLTYLDITNNSITNEGVKQFGKLQKITHLYLMSNKLTMEGILSLITSMEKLQFLDVRFNVWSNDEKEEIKKNKRESLQILC